MIVMSNVVAPLLATFDLRIFMVCSGISSLYFRGFLHGSYLIKNLTSARSSPLWGKEYRPFSCVSKKEKNNLWWRWPSVIFLRRPPLTIKCKIYVGYQYSKYEWLSSPRCLLGRMSLVFLQPSPCRVLPILAIACPLSLHLVFFLALGLRLVFAS
jgi:hypothetical protein